MAVQKSQRSKSKKTIRYNNTKIFKKFKITTTKLKNVTKQFFKKN